MSRRVRLGFFVLTVFLPWISARGSRIQADPTLPGGLRLLRAIRHSETALKVLNVCCTCYFLVDGRHPSLPMLLLSSQLM